MTSQIVPGANQQFHTTPLFWEAKKVPRQRAAYKQDFPIENLHLFTALAGLDSANRVKLKTLGIFFRLHLATPKSGISPRAAAFFFFQIAGHWDGTVLKSLLHQKLVFFFGRQKKTKGNKKKLQHMTAPAIS